MRESELLCFSECLIRKSLQQSDDCCYVWSDFLLSRERNGKRSFPFWKHVQERGCEWRLLHYQPRRQDELLTQMQVSDVTASRCLMKSRTEIVSFFAHKPTRGIIRWTIRLPTQQQFGWGKWTCLSHCSEVSLIQPTEQESGPDAQHLDKKTLA